MSNVQKETQDRWRYRESRKRHIESALNSAFDSRKVSTPEDLTEVLRKVCEETLRKPRRGTRRGKPWWSAKIASLRADFLRVRRTLTRGNKKYHGTAPAELVERYNLAYKAFQDEKTSAKERLHNRLCDELDNNPWGDAYQIAMGRLKPRKPTKLPKNLDTVLSKLFPKHAPVSFNEESNEGYMEFSIEEVIHAANKLKGGKSPGPDGIPAEVVQIAVTQNPEVFVAVMNDLLRKGEFPSIWKRGDLRLIPKEGNSDLNPKYRPICLLNTLSKLYEQLIKSRLSAELDRTNGISANQHAYSKGRSTNTAMEAVLNFCDKTYKRGPGWTPAIILLDILNAFNSAAWLSILNRLRKLGVKPYLTRIIQSYLSERYLNVNGKDFKLTSGVPQGSILGPILWNAIFDEISSLKLPDYCMLVLYADDLALLIAARCDRDMKLRGNLAIKRIYEWAAANQMKIATEKTTALIARGKRTAVTKNTIFEANGFKVMPKSNIKYLGVWFDENLNFQHHAHMASTDATKAFNCLAGILSLSNVRMARRRTIASVVESKLLYGCEVWLGRMPGCAIKVLESVQREAAIRVCKGYSTISADAALVLAGMVPINIKANARQSKYRTGVRMTEDDIYKQWQRRWETCGKGSWTRELIPRIRVWTGRKHGELGYYLTQIMTGHGNFGFYLKLMNKVKNSKCQICNVCDTVVHTLFECEGGKSEREDLFRKMGHTTKENLVPSMLLSPRNWKSVESYIDSVMKAKKS